MKTLAIAATLAAMFTALTTGLAFTALDRAGLIEGSNPQAESSDVEWRNVRNFDLSLAIKCIRVDIGRSRSLR